MSSPVTFFGHTHIQGGFSQKDHNWHILHPRLEPAGESNAASWTLDLPPGTRHLINPGSVGQPRDRDWRAAFATFDSEACQIVFHRVPYALAGAQARIAKAGLPARLSARLREGR
jgi:diadenosine tetraphosphatase ApaH/serine/threonine PP2A family protein phosphatase